MSKKRCQIYLIDAAVDKYRLLRDQPRSGEQRVPTLRDATLVVAIRRRSKVILQRDIWM